MTTRIDDARRLAGLLPGWEWDPETDFRGARFVGHKPPSSWNFNYQNFPAADAPLTEHGSFVFWCLSRVPQVIHWNIEGPLLDGEPWFGVEVCHGNGVEAEAEATDLSHAAALAAIQAMEGK